MLQVVAAAFLSSNGIWVRFSSLGLLNTGFYRMVFAIIFLLPMAWKDIPALKKKDWLILFFAGAFLAGDIAVFNYSMTRTSLANANLLVNMTPFVILPVSYFLFKEKIPKFFFVGALVAITGVVILICGKAAPTSMNYQGDLLAFVAMFFYAVYILITYRMRDRLPGNAIMFGCTVSACLVLFVIAGIGEGNQIPTTWHQFWPLLCLGICQQAIGQGLFVHCQGKLSVNLTSIIALSQPAIAAVYSFLIFGEKLSAVEILGIVVVVIGIFLVKMQYQKKS
jgi:drug/metabolite transporter (DMT)-like permease